MFYFEVPCRYCQQTFKVQEGSKKYQQYKVNRTTKLSCDECDRKIESDARKYLFNRD